MYKKYSYKEAMEFGSKVVDFKDRKTGKTSPWYVNSRLCNLARRFHGGYDWHKPGGFRKMVRIETNTWGGNFWRRSLHNLGKTHEDIFSFFTDFMTDDSKFNFKQDNINNLVDFWVKSFKEELYEIGEMKILKKYSNEDFVKAYYYVVANTVQGILDEEIALDGLRKLFENDKDISVDYGSALNDYQDCDLIIKKKDKLWHKVSVKSNRGFTYECINKYRVGSDYSGDTKKNKEITVYCDADLNRVFFRKNEDIPYKIVVNKSNGMIEEMIEKWRLDE